MSTRMYIGELAKQVGVNPKTIRYYEEIGLLPEPERADSNYRVYSPESIRRLSFVKKAQLLGMALDEIKGVLAIRENGQLPCEHVRSLLAHKLGELDRQIDQIREFRRELTRYLDDVEERAQTGQEEAICPDIERFTGSGESHASQP